MANPKSKLKIYKCILRKKGSTEPVSNNDFYSEVGEGTADQNGVFRTLAKAYYESFNGKFAKDNKGDRAISISNNELIGFKSEHKIIHGFLNGGITNTEFKEFDIGDSANSKRDIDRNKVLGQNHYFLLWLPNDTNFAFVFLQYNDSVIRGITSAFFDHLDKFLGNYNFKISRQPYAPKRVIEEYVNNSTICEIEFIQSKMVDEDSPLIGEIKTYRLRHKIAGIHLPVIGLNTISGDTIREIKAMIGIADEGDLSTMVRYKKGRTSRKAKLDDNKLIPDIDIPDETINGGLSLDNMFIFVKRYVEMANIEIGNLT